MIRCLPSGIGTIAHRWYKRLETKEHPLLYVFLELTRKCNLSCRHCGSDCTSAESSAQLTTESWLRGRPDSYARAIAAITRAAHSAIPLSDVVTCVHSKNIEELDSLATLLLSMNVKSWRLFRVFPAGRAKSDAALSLDQAGMRQMISWVAENKRGLRQRGLSVSLSCEGWLPLALDRKVRDTPFFCRAGVNIASILCDGTITGCSNNPAPFFEGSILTANFAALWQNGFAKFREWEWVEKSSCSRCRHVRDCQGGSIHLWQSSMGKPDFCYAASPDRTD